jgi:hypothetical protein
MDEPAEFDAAVLGALNDLSREGIIAVHHGRLELEVDAEITWGTLSLRVA